MNPVPARYPSVTIPLNDAQSRWLENVARFLERETGCAVSVESVLLRLMELGRKDFERELEELRARANESCRRFPRLQLAYSRIEPEGLRR